AEVAAPSPEPELFDDPAARAAARETRRDDRSLQPLQRPRDVNALAARGGEPAARPVPVTELEVRNGQRPVDRGIQSYGDDQSRCTTPLRRLLDADLLTDAEGCRVDARVEVFERGDRRSRLRRDRRQRVAGHDGVPPHGLLRSE